MGGTGGNACGLEGRGELAGRGIFLAFPGNHEAAADEPLLVEGLNGGEPAFGWPGLPWAAAAWMDGEGAAAGGAGGGGQLEGMDWQIAGKAVGELEPCWSFRLHGPWSLMDLRDAALPEALPGDALWVREP